MKKSVTQFRQGDLLFIKRDVLPKEAKRSVRRILAEGEGIGHLHQVADIADVYEVGNDTVWVVAPEDGLQVNHPEHGPFVLDEGVWEVASQSQVTPTVIEKVTPDPLPVRTPAWD